MIRSPSSYARLYAWHRAYLAGQAPEMHDGMPECGWYQRTLVTGGPLVPVEIRCERDIDPETGELTGPERLVAYVDGERSPNAAGMWTYLTPISREAFDRLVERRASIPAMAATMAKLDLSATPMRP